MITIVDRNDTHIVQKVVAPRKAPRYQVVANSSIGDSDGVIVRNTLAEARRLIGKGQNGRPLTASSNG